MIQQHTNTHSEIQITCHLTKLPKEILDHITQYLPCLSQISFKLTSKRNLDSGLSLYTLSQRLRQRPRQWFISRCYAEDRGRFTRYGERSQLACSACLKYHDHKYFSDAEKLKPSIERRCIGSLRRVWLSGALYLSFCNGRFSISALSTHPVSITWHTPPLTNCARVSVGSYLAARPWALGRLFDFIGMNWQELAFNSLTSEPRNETKALEALNRVISCVDYPACPHMQVKDIRGIGEKIIDSVISRTEELCLHPSSQLRGARRLRGKRPHTLTAGTDFVERHPETDMKSIPIGRFCSHCRFSKLRIRLSHLSPVIELGGELVTWLDEQRASLSLEFHSILGDGKDVANPGWISQATTQEYAPDLSGWSVRKEVETWEHSTFKDDYWHAEGGTTTNATAAAAAATTTTTTTTTTSTSTTTTLGTDYGCGCGCEDCRDVVHYSPRCPPTRDLENEILRGKSGPRVCGCPSFWSRWGRSGNVHRVNTWKRIDLDEVARM